MPQSKTHYTFLKEYYPFSDIPENILTALTSEIVTQTFNVGMTINKKGDNGEFLYIVKQGSVYEVIVDENGDESIVSILNVGDCFGAISLLTDEERLVTTKAKDDVLLLAIKKDDLNRIINKYPKLIKYLNRILKLKIDSFFKFFEKERIKVVSEIKQADEKERELFILNKAAELMRSESPDDVLQKITEEMKTIMGADLCCVFLLDPISKKIVLETGSGKANKLSGTACLNIDEGITGWVIRTGEPVVVEDIKQDSRVKFIKSIGEEKLVSLLSVPLIEQKNIIGAINICTFTKRKFTYQEVRGAEILANHIALAVSNSRLRRKVKAISKARGNQKLGDFDRFVGETALLRKLNTFIERSSAHENQILIDGEEGTGKTLMARLIHKNSKRYKGPFIALDCQTFNENSWAEELLGSKKKIGFLEACDGGTIFLRNIDSLKEVMQITLYNFMKTGKFVKVDNDEKLESNVRIISTVSSNLEKEVSVGNFNSSLYKLISQNTFTMQPLRKRRRDIPIIANHIIDKLNLELHKNIRKLSNLAGERLLSYDWPGNILELENVLRRAVLIAEDDKILSEQIFFGIPRIEKKWEYNLLSIPWLKDFLFKLSYPKILQKVNLLITSLFISILFFGGTRELNNSANIILWTFGWFGLYVTVMIFGRLWCGICPFSLLGDWAKSIVSLNLSVPKTVVRLSNTSITILILLFFWVEGAYLLHMSPVYTAYLLLSIPIGAIVFSMLFDRHVWCRYFCPLGGIMGVYSILAFITLRANRKICLSQCQTHECYLGGKTKGCPLFLHPYGLENNQHCTLCSYCFKNCTYDAIHIPLRAPFSQTPVMEPSAYIISLLVLALNGIIMVENGSILSIDSVMFGKISSIINLPELFIYTVLFIICASLPIVLFYTLNKILNRMQNNDIHEKIKEFGYSFIPLSITGHIAFFLEKIIDDGKNIGWGIDLIYNLLHIGEYKFGLGIIIQSGLIISGILGCNYLILQTKKRFDRNSGIESSVKPEKILNFALAFMYICILILV